MSTETEHLENGEGADAERPSDATCSAAGGDDAQDALNRMKRASHRGTGCYLTAQMIQSLQVTQIGEMWEQEDPRQ